MAPSRASALARKGDRLLSTQELCALYRCHKATIQRRMKNDPDFPKPVRVRLNHLAFWESEAYAYVASKQDA